MQGTKKLLILTRYDRLGASSRLRFYHYQSRLENDGWCTEYRPLIPDVFLQSGYQGSRRPWLKLLFCYLQRFFYLLFRTRSFDLVWVEKELFPGLPTFVDSFLLKKMKKVILDYDDAVYLNYQKSGWGRFQKINRLISHSDLVFAGSPSLADFAGEWGGKVVRVPTPVEPVQLSTLSSDNVLRLGWVGSPASQGYLEILRPTFENLKSRQDIKFHLMGVTPDSFADLPNVKVHPWSEQRQGSFLESVDFGLMPLNDGLWEQGKCSYKILLYFSHGIPALASDVGMNREVVSDEQNGWLVGDAWFEKINQLSQIGGQRYQQMSAKALQTVEDRYSYDRIYQVISTEMNKLIGI